MAQPKKKLSSTRGSRRRSHLHLDAPSVSMCSNCSASINPHTVCQHCGFYKGKKVRQTKG